jgi:hypothetical protein
MDNPAHTWHLGNYDASDQARLQSAIDESGRDISIRQGAYDQSGRMWDGSRISIWCDELEGDLTEFWDLVEPVSA